MWSVNHNTERALNVKRLRSRIRMNVRSGGIRWSEMKKDLGRKKEISIFSFSTTSVTQRPPRLLKLHSALSGANQLAGRCIFPSQLFEYFIKVGASSTNEDRQYP